VYPIKGYDSIGEIDCARRFSNFDDFRKILIERYPGLYIPPVPPKMQDKKGALVLEERRHFLDMFMKECCSLSYIASSNEM